MKLFTDEFKELKKASVPLYKTPKSVQETIEIIAVSEEGIFQTGQDTFDKCWRMSNINYVTASDEVQESIAIAYCKFLNSMDCEFKITANNKKKNWSELEKRLFASLDTTENLKYRISYNEIITDKVRLGTHGIEQELYLTVTVRRKSYEEAKAHFATIEANLNKRFTEFGSNLEALNGNERLQILYDYYHLGNEDGFKFNLKEYKKNGQDFRNDLCNTAVRFFPDYYEEEGKFCRVMFIKTYSSSSSDRMFVDISSLPIYSMTSECSIPVPKKTTMKVMHNKILGIDSDIIKQQNVRNRQNISIIFLLELKLELIVIAQLLIS